MNRNNQRNVELVSELDQLMSQLPQAGHFDSQVQAGENERCDLNEALSINEALSLERSRVKSLEEELILVKDQLESVNQQFAKEREQSNEELQMLQTSATQSGEANAQIQLLVLSMQKELQKLQAECKHHAVEAEQAPFLRQTIAEQTTRYMLLQSELKCTFPGDEPEAEASTSEQRIKWLEERLRKEMDNVTKLEQQMCFIEDQLVSGSEANADKILAKVAAKKAILSCIGTCTSVMSARQERDTLEEQLLSVREQLRDAQRYIQVQDSQTRAANAMAGSPTPRVTRFQESLVEAGPLPTHVQIAANGAIHLHKRDVQQLPQALDDDVSVLRQELQDARQKMAELYASAAELERNYAQSQGSYMVLQARHMEVQAECEHYKKELANQRSQFELERVAFWEELGATRHTLPPSTFAHLPASPEANFRPIASVVGKTPIASVVGTTGIPSAVGTTPVKRPIVQQGNGASLLSRSPSRVPSPPPAVVRKYSGDLGDTLLLPRRAGAGDLLAPAPPGRPLCGDTPVQLVGSPVSATRSVMVPNTFMSASMSASTRYGSPSQISQRHGSPSQTLQRDAHSPVRRYRSPTPVRAVPSNAMPMVVTPRSVQRTIFPQGPPS